MMDKKNVLFVCVGNSGRSQIAEAFFNHLTPANFKATSAGTKPASRVSSNVIQVMREVGIDINDAKPKQLTPEMVKKADKIILMGCIDQASCPAFILEDKSKLEDWRIPDPKDEPIERVREIREQIYARILELVQTLG